MSRPPEKRTIAGAIYEYTPLNLFRPSDIAARDGNRGLCSEVRDQFNLPVREWPHAVPGPRVSRPTGPNIGGPTTNNHHGTP